MALKPIFQQLFGGGSGGVANPTVNAAKTVVSGTGVKPNSTVTVYKNGTSAGTATANGSGAWSYTFGSALQPGDIVTYDAVLTSPATTVATTAPAAPTISVTAGNGQATISWSDGATGGAAITSHKLYRGTVSGQRTLVGTISTASPYVDTGLTNGMAYFYSLSAVNSVGEGAQSSEVSVVPTAVPAIAPGAVGLWWFDQIDTTANIVPNAMASTAYDGNLLRAPRRMFSKSDVWSTTSLTVSNDGTTAISIPGASNDATTFTPTAPGWLLRAQSGSLPAGTYTLAVTGYVSSGTCVLNYNLSGDNTTRIPFATLTTTPQRYSVVFTAASSFNPTNIIVLGDGTNTAPFIAMDLKLYSGTKTLSANATDAPSGHLALGITAGDTTVVGKYAGGELNMSGANAGGIVQLASAVAAGGPFTAQAMVRKTAAGTGYQAFLSKVQNYADFSAFLQQAGAPVYANNGTNGLVPGFWRRQDYGRYTVITHRFDGTNYSIWLDDICLCQASGSGNAGIADLWFNLVNQPGFYTGDRYAGGMALYASALTNKQIVDNGTAFRARAQAAGVSSSLLAPVDKFILIEGDSRSAGGPNGTTGTWPSKVGSALTAPIFGVVNAVAGATLDSGSNQVAGRITAMPALPTRSGFKVIGLLGMMGANDLGSYAGATDAAAVSAYRASEGTNVFDAWTAKGVTVRAMISELPFPANGTNTHNTRRNLLNTANKSAFPGSNPGTYIDLNAGDPVWADDNGGVDYPTYYISATNGHPSPTVGDGSIVNIVTPVLNQLMAA